MKINKMILCLFFSFLLILPFSSANLVITQNSENDLVKSDNSNAKWTVMLYCAFDNHRDAEKNHDFKIMANIGSTSDFKLVTLFDGETRGDTLFAYIEKDTIIPLAWYESESNMGDPQTLQRFIQLSMHHFPADHYALFIMSAYGSGWQGLGCDKNGVKSTKELTLLNMKDYKTVLENIINNSNKIDVIGFDICVTASVEAAYQMAPYITYMIGTEEHGFGGENEISDEGYLLGWNYTNFLTRLKNNPDMTPEDFSKYVTNCYQPGTYTYKIFGKIKAPKWYPITRFYTTISTVNLSKIDVLKNSIKDLAYNLTDNLKDCRNDIRKARSKVREYGKLYRRFWWLPPAVYYLQLDPLGYDCFIDIYDFAEKLKHETGDSKIKTSCDKVMQAVNDTVIANKALNTDPSHGLFVYFPQLRCQYDVSIWRVIGIKNFKKIPVPYEDLDFSQGTQWDEFLKGYLYI